MSWSQMPFVFIFSFECIKHNLFSLLVEKRGNRYLLPFDLVLFVIYVEEMGDG